MKKTEKSSNDPHREFLDMDSDEEEFSRQESLETEEELLPEPVKPVFNEQDLNNLVCYFFEFIKLDFPIVQYVKDLTIFPSIKESDWKDCYTVVREYFENPIYALLSIYFEMDTLRAGLSVPEDDQNEFMYFLRTPWHVFTVDNFHATVIYGSLNCNTMMCVLKTMENIYAPIVLNSSEWPEIIRNNLFFNLHNFLMDLTEWIYKPLGLTKLYVPQEILPDVTLPPKNEKSDLSEKDGQYISNKLRKSEKAQIDRFERIVRYWIKQIREALTNITSLTRGVIFDELQHWTAIYFNLCCLHNQLLSEEIQSILRLLENVHSPSVDSFQLLTLQLHERLEQAGSNVTYLNILSDACNDLKCPIEIEEPVTKILLLILFIWTESPFYNISHNIQILCEAISAQIVQQCKNYIDLQAILEGEAKNGINILQKCISCCETYKIVYSKVTSITVHIESNRDWQMNEQFVFKRIDTFTQRCYDVIEIYNALIVFGRCNKVGMIGGTKGTEHEEYCRRIENLFYENLEEIKLVRDNILDVTNSTWLKNMQKFRESVKELENMIVNLIDRIFEEVQTIEEGIEAIYALQRFKYRESLRDILSTKWVQVWKIFGKEIESCNNSITLGDVYHPLLQHHSENTITLCISKYLERLFHMMIDASDWIGECAAQKYILEQYEKVKSSIDNKLQHNLN
ncbi:dynein heavy chain 2, axonemal-like [Camponotus floridanus]|uniref:dynein heavy chain 2, axonemal-like n=1 Tax=Camponotus floridanus TaxID=104421 RepID=UPI000DC6A36B|nr:dynein heavy chain 2, axonemal-like [Camponotus floridanus]